MAKKLSDREVWAIREAVRTGESTRKEQQELYEVSLETIARICRGDTRSTVSGGNVARMDQVERIRAENSDGAMERIMARVGAMPEYKEDHEMTELEKRAFELTGKRPIKQIAVPRAAATSKTAQELEEEAQRLDDLAAGMA